MDVCFRLATLSDLEMLLEWRNDPETRANSKNSGSIPREVHEAWLRGSLGNPDRKLFVAECSGDSIGTVRLDRREGTWELSWTVAPASRGKGFGTVMVAEATKLVSGNLVAEIKETNTASIRIAQQAGFELVVRSAGMAHFIHRKGR